jgi:uncharacterized Fe-S cluster protein YjdI
MKKSYTNAERTVYWEAEKCIHSANCARGLGEVFKPREKPWIQLGQTESKRIANQIDLCPSAALSYKWK